MAKNALDDYSTTAASNSDIDGLDSTGATGLVKSGDNYARSIMAHAKAKMLDLGASNTVAGTGDAITVTLASNTTALYDGMRISVNAPGTNTGAATIAVTNSGATLLGTKKIRKWSGGSETALSAGDITQNHILNLVYDSARDTASGAFMIDGSASVAAATTSAAGIVELATAAEALAGTDTSRAVTPSGLYFPTGHLYGLTLSNNASDATNDIDIAAGTARDGSDTINMVLASALTKRGDASWAVGTGNGGMDTGAIADGVNYVWLIKRSDTGVVDALISASGTAPTMPTNYDYKRLIGKFHRASGVNKAPRSYSVDQTDWVAYTPTFTGFGTVSNVSMWSRRVGDSLEIRGKFTAGTTTATEARITLGAAGTNDNVVSDATKVTAIQLAGSLVQTAVGGAAYYTLIESAVGYLTIGAQTSGIGGLTKRNGDVFTNSSSVTLQALIPIAGW